VLLASLFGRYPFLKTLFADTGYQARQFQQDSEEQLGPDAVSCGPETNAGVGLGRIVQRSWVKVGSE